MISLYETYLKENEIDFLVNYIKKYHEADIEQYLKGVSHLPEKANIDMLLRRKTDKDKAYEKLVETQRIKFASWVYGRIIQNENFIRQAANKYPLLFANILRGMETTESSNEDLVKLYIECLFENKNQLLLQELKIVNGSNSSVLEMSKSYDIPILYSLFVQTKVAVENYVWYPVGEGVVKSLKHDDSQKEFLKKEYDSDLETELWNQKVFIAMVYFDYMVRETIFRDSEWHMWLFYFRNTNELLIELIPSADYEEDSPYPTFAHYVINEQFSVMDGWLELSKEQENDNRVIDTIRCMGWCLHTLCEADNSKISATFKRRQFNLILRTYFQFSHFSDNAGAITARQWIENLFLNNNGMDFGAHDLTENYLAALQDAWNHFDKVPYQYHANNGSIERFVVTVITPLGLQE